MDWSEIKFFKKTEFDCNCGCGRNEMDEEFIRTLDHLRFILKKPIIITSGYRCPDYNALVSKTGRTGPHTTGKAADVSTFGRDAFNLVRQCTLGGYMQGIGLRQHGNHRSRFIHLDNLTAADSRYRPTIWTYASD